MTGTMDETCWADPLSRKERAELARKLARACNRLWRRQYAFVGILDKGSPYRAASAEMSDLHLDVTERAAVPEG